MAFIEQRLLECVTDGSGGTPTFNTLKIPLRSGVVRRRPMQSMPRYRFNVNYNNIEHAQYAALRDAFNACFGGAHSFRYKDWEDFEAADALLSVLGTGSAQEVQLTKTYTWGAQAVERRIRKPVTGTVAMTQNGSPLTATIDYTTGLATFTATASAVLRWSGEFDVPVYFDQDELPFSGDNVGNEQRILTGDVVLMEDISI